MAKTCPESCRQRRFLHCRNLSSHHRTPLHTYGILKLTSMFPNPEFSKKAEELLTEQVGVLSLLASGPGAEFVFFTYDIENKIRYLSESSWKVFQIRPENWRLQPFQSRLTDHKWNSSHLHAARDFEVDRIHRSKCEFRDDFGVGVKIDLWRRPVHLDGKIIGVVGMAKRYIEIGLEGNTQPISPPKCSARAHRFTHQSRTGSHRLGDRRRIEQIDRSKTGHCHSNGRVATFQSNDENGSRSFGGFSPHLVYCARGDVKGRVVSLRSFEMHQRLVAFKTSSILLAKFSMTGSRSAR